MNKTFIIGNLTRDPELRTTQQGNSVCNFTVAVNRRHANNAEAGQPEADYFKVTAWRQLGENCARYLAKGRKVAVVGTVSTSAYVGNDGQAYANLELRADEVEFLTPRSEANEAPTYTPAPVPTLGQAYGIQPQQGGGFVRVDEEELPF